jgi:ABC-type transport system involved in cytochrome bd biosynthesis fused ATPase/permease subunit
MITPTEKADSTVKIFNFIKQVVKSVNDSTEIAKKIWDFLTKDYDLGYSEQNTELVAKTLHRMNTGTAPRIALVGMTSAGKSTLTNALFGKSIAI